MEGWGEQIHTDRRAWYLSKNEASHHEGGEVGE